MEKNTQKLGIIIGSALMLISHLFLAMVSFMGYSSTMFKAIGTTTEFYVKMLLVLLLLAPIYLLLSAFSDHEALKSLRPIFRVNLRMASLIPLALLLLLTMKLNGGDIVPVLGWGYNLYMLAAFFVAYLANKETVDAHPVAFGIAALYVIFLFMPTISYQYSSYTMWKWLSIEGTRRFLLPKWIKWICWGLLILPAYAAVCANKEKELLAAARPALVIPVSLTMLCVSVIALLMVGLLVICSFVYAHHHTERHMAPQIAAYLYLAISICLTYIIFRAQKK